MAKDTGLSRYTTVSSIAALSHFIQVLPMMLRACLILIQRILILMEADERKFIAFAALDWIRY